MREILIEQGRFLTRAVVLEEGKLAAVYAEHSKTAGRVGEIYSGRVENVLSGLQAAFVDIGLPQKAFLHVQQLAGHVRTPIQKRLRAGQWVLVHVGFAMSVINEAEARDTLEALQNMFDVEPDVGALLYGEER